MRRNGGLKLRREKVIIKSSSLQLEGILAIPDGTGPFGAVIVCHPHPLYGGNMHNNVVLAVCRGAGEHNLASLRFNFRGVGGSNGSFAQGIGEREDALSAISFVAQRPEIDPARLGICGYSFGSAVAFSSAVQDKRIKAVAGISPFIEPEGLLSDYINPKMFLCGTQDGLIDTENLKKVISSLPDYKEAHFIAGVDHFWIGTEHLVASKTGSYFGCFI